MISPLKFPYFVVVAFLFAVAAFGISPGILFAAGDLGEECRVFPDTPECDLGSCISGKCLFDINLINPINGVPNVDYGRSSYFQWEEISGTSHYELIIAGVVQRADNIEPTACSEGICSLWFLDSARPVTIQCLEKAGGSYFWRVEAYDVLGVFIGGSSSTSFDTKTCPSPGSGGPNSGNGGGTSSPSGGGGIPAVLKNPISSETLPQLLNNVLNFLFSLSIVILPIMILYGGFLMLTAGGDPTKISQSRTILLWAIVAFAIILLARGLPEVIRTLL